MAAIFVRKMAILEIFGTKMAAILSKIKSISEISSLSVQLSSESVNVISPRQSAFMTRGSSNQASYQEQKHYQV